MSLSLPPAGGGVDAGQAVDAEVHGVSLWRGALRRLRRNPTAIVGALIVLAFVSGRDR